MITTIITTYQRPKLLKRAVNSVLNQTYPDFQVFVYDNGSDDETADLMKELTKKDTRIKYHRHPKNIGMMPNYKYALDRVDTPFFSFLSDDDFLLPNFFETAIKNFQKSPNAAFVACGICQMDVHGNFVGNPIGNWPAEGTYLPPEGLLEMVKMRRRFPVPTGVLFQSKFLKNIKPNFSKEIELFWDPDYLLRIAASHPIVIDKKICGIYLAHSQSYANFFYENLLNDVPSVEKFIIATKKTMESIKNCRSLRKADRLKAEQFFTNYIELDTEMIVKAYIFNSIFSGAAFLSKTYRAHIGFSTKILFLQIISFFLNILSPKKKSGHSWIGLFSLMSKCYNKLKSLLLRCLVTKKTQPPISTSINSNELQSYHDYGQELLNSFQKLSV
jgi:glycosyltransferase involved in cell wall biosynthesis